IRRWSGHPQTVYGQEQAVLPLSAAFRFTTTVTPSSTRVRCKIRGCLLKGLSGVFDRIRPATLSFLNFSRLQGRYLSRDWVLNSPICGLIVFTPGHAGNTSK